MAKKKIDDVDLLLSELDKAQLADFIRKECKDNIQLRNRFLAIGVGTFFKPTPATYTYRVEDLINKYGGRHGFIEYRDTFKFNRDVTGILDEADEAMKKGQWDVAIAILTGIASVAEDILSSGDDSAGELGAIINDCFYKWNELCSLENLPESIKSEIFELALTRFNDKDLKGWDWWWDWMQMAVDLADTREKQTKVFKALDAIKPNGDDWDSRYAVKTAQNFKLEMMSHCESEEDQIKFMYDNISNSDFRRRLMQMAWDKGDYEEVLRLAKDGVNQDTAYPGLLSDWHKWQYRVFSETGDKSNQLQLARHFFFTGGLFGDKEFRADSMYAVLKSLVSKSEWSQYVQTLISDAVRNRDNQHLLYIYTEEKMWPEYMEYVRKNPSIRVIDEAPEELKKTFRDETVTLYTSAVNRFFQHASTRTSYQEGVELLRKLIKYGGKKEAAQIVKEQKSRTPRRPALIDELSRL